MSKDSKFGGKYTGSHSTTIPVAAVACDIAYTMSCVTKISVGFIKAGLRSVSGRARVKIVEEGPSCLLLLVRGNTSHQEVRLYVTDVQNAKAAIARKLIKARINVCFRH
jgi:hypothetical protein